MADQPFFSGYRLYVIGALLVALALIAALLKAPPPHTGLGGSGFGGDVKPPQGGGLVTAQNSPAVIEFKGDLAEKGIRQNNDVLLPFVVGEILELDADTSNAVEFRWTINGQLLPTKGGGEWSKSLKREYEITQAGEFHFGLQARGEDPKDVSPLREAVIKAETLYIESFGRHIIQPEDDRMVTGKGYTLTVSMAEPVQAGPDFYLFRYLVNDAVYKDPVNQQEWTENRDITIKLNEAGHYAFKVEVRRSSIPGTKPEASMEAEDTIIVADAVLTQFDQYPEKFAPAGSPVRFSTFPESRTGESECRFGYKLLSAPDFDWVDFAVNEGWGAPDRIWVPETPGNYLIRAEIREKGKGVADDFRELLYTVGEGKGTF